MNFGPLMRKLRSERGLTQVELADRVGVSLNTIQRGEHEKAERCPWRRSLAIAVIGELEKRAPLTQADAARYLELAGLEALARFGQDTLARVKAERDDAVADFATADNAFNTKGDEKATYAMLYLYRIIEHSGSDIALDLITSIGQIAGIQRPLQTPEQMRRTASAWYFRSGQAASPNRQKANQKRGTP